MPLLTNIGYAVWTRQINQSKYSTSEQLGLKLRNECLWKGSLNVCNELQPGNKISYSYNVQTFYDFHNFMAQTAQ